MTFRNVGGKYTTPRTFIESGMVQLLQNVVAEDPDLAAIFEYDPSNCRWGPENGWPIEFENYNAQTALTYARSNQRPWFRTRVLNNDSVQIALGRFGLSRYYCMGNIGVFVKRGGGVARQRIIIDVINDWFKDLNPETGGDQVNIGLTTEEWAALTIRQPYMMNIGNQDDASWYRNEILVPLEIDIKYQDTTS